MNSTRHKVYSTGLKTETINLTWKIDNFDEIRQYDDLVRTQSINFSAGKSIDLLTEWEFQLKQSGKRLENQHHPSKYYTGIFLCLKSSLKDIKEVLETFKITVRNADKSSFYNLSTGICKHNKENPAWGLPQIHPDDTNLQDSPLIDGRLEIDIEFTVFAQKATRNVRDFAATEKLFKMKSAEQLQDDLAKLLETSASENLANSKPTIISSDMENFVVSQEILAARSPVFQNMFHSKMKESIPC